MPFTPKQPRSGAPSPFSDEKTAREKNRKPAVTPNQSRLPKGLVPGKGMRAVKPMRVPGKAGGR